MKQSFLVILFGWSYLKFIENYRTYFNIREMPSSLPIKSGERYRLFRASGFLWLLTRKFEQRQMVNSFNDQHVMTYKGVDIHIVS